MKYPALLVLGSLLLASARAQEVIIAKEGYDTNPVVAVKSDDTPIVLVNGSKARPAVGKAKLTIKPGVTYHDAFFTIKPFKMQPAADAGQVLITGTVRPDRTISHGFVAVEVKGSDGKTDSVRVTALPDNMTPGNPGSFAIQVPGKEGRKSKTRPEVHFFVGPLEVISSAMTPAETKAAKQKRDEFTLKRTPSRGVSPVYAVAPGYPEALRDSGQPGTAKVLCHIDTEGRVTEAKIQEASAPEFGEAAVAATKTWLFAPAIKDGQFVETDVLIPINFAPAKKKAQ